MASKKTSKKRQAVTPRVGTRSPAGRGLRPKRTPAATAPTDPAVSREIALLAAAAGLDKKALGVQIIDVTGKVDYADYLVLMSGQSDRHVASIADHVDALLSKAGHRSLSVEGLPKADWVLIDLVDVVVHVFREELRPVYDLDGLWMDAARLPVPEPAPEPAAPPKVVLSPKARR